MPRRELTNGQQVHDWLKEVSEAITAPAEITLIGSGALLWHAFDRGIQAELPEASMDVDPLTNSEEVARICYDALIGSPFEQTHGWHVNLMPDTVLREFPADWQERATKRHVGQLDVIVPAPEDLLVPKLKRGEPRDMKHIEWAKRIGLTRQ
ncbi:MAG: hypothetical protein L0Y58_03625 [Verrucomicrobia subdivision 3 bacterium]|nr:hypothetical protein [Limisphaerales bacterium]